jgi:hypothetical protein
MVQPNKPLAAMEDEELKGLLSSVSKNVIYGYNDVVNELERRRTRRQSNRTFALSLVAIIVSVLSLVASVLVALYKK